MKVSELIKDLQRVLENDGDLKVASSDDGWFFYNVSVSVVEDITENVVIIK